MEKRGEKGWGRKKLQLIGTRIMDIKMSYAMDAMDPTKSSNCILAGIIKYFDLINHFHHRISYRPMANVVVS